MQEEIVLTSLFDQLPGAQLMTAGTQQQEGCDAMTQEIFLYAGR
jgi:hypothetical protein